jgi:hypothetical protein
MVIFLSFLNFLNCFSFNFSFQSLKTFFFLLHLPFQSLTPFSKLSFNLILLFTGKMMFLWSK